MKPTDDLFLLIKSMTPTEKGYFIKYASLYSKKGESDYEKLFNAINRQNEYDELKIKAALKGERLLKRLPAVKNYLFNFILKSMSAYYSGNSVEYLLTENIQHIDFLCNKGHFPQALKIASKTVKIALENESFTYYLKAIELYQNILFRQASTDIDFIQKMTNQNKENSITQLEQYSNYLKYLFIHNEILLNIKYFRSERFKNIGKLQDPLKDINLENAKSIKAKKLFYKIKIAVYWLNRDHEHSLKYVIDLTKLLEKNPTLIKNDPDDYIESLIHLAVNYEKLEQYNKALSILDKIHTISVKSISTKIKNIERIAMLEIQICNVTGEFAKGRSIINRIKSEIIEFGPKMKEEVLAVLYISIASFHIYIGELNEALTWLNKCLSELGKNKRADIFHYAKMLSLIVHFDLGNDLLIESNAKSIYTNLFKKKDLLEFDKAILSFIRKSTTIKNKEKMIDLMKDLKKELIDISTQKEEKAPFQYFDYISWIDSKIENKPISGILKSKTRR